MVGTRVDGNCPRDAIFLRRRSFPRKNGAVEKINIEPQSLSKVFEELENWETCLRAEPEVMQKLLALETADSGPEEQRKIEGRRPSPMRGPAP